MTDARSCALDDLARSFELDAGQPVIQGKRRPRSGTMLPSPPSGFSPVALELATAMYGTVYNKPRGGMMPMPDQNLRWHFVEQLRAANRGQGRLNADGTRGEKDSARQVAWYYAFSDEPKRPSNDQVRFYFNIVGCGAHKLVAAVTGHLNKARIPFDFKTLQDPQLYRRADSAVLYVDAQDAAAVQSQLVAVWTQVRPWLADEVPGFTKPLGWGLAYAESPRNRSLSFGQHRCLLVAKGIERAYSESDGSPDARRRCIEDEFLRQGIDPDRPYLREAKPLAG